MRASPLQEVMDRFGSSGERSTEARKSAKQGLIKAVQGYVTKGDLLKADFSEKGIDRVSNKKLLRLLDLAETVEKEHGSRAALLDKLLEIEGRDKDAGYRAHLDRRGLAALHDSYKAARKRTR